MIDLLGLVGLFDVHDARDLSDLRLALGLASLEQLHHPRQTVSDVSTGHATRVEGPHGELCARFADGLGGDVAHRFADGH